MALNPPTNMRMIAQAMGMAVNIEWTAANNDPDGAWSYLLLIGPDPITDAVVDNYLADKTTVPDEIKDYWIDRGLIRQIVFGENGVPIWAKLCAVTSVMQDRITMDVVAPRSATLVHLVASVETPVAPDLDPELKLWMPKFSPKDAVNDSMYKILVSAGLKEDTDFLLRKVPTIEIKPEICHISSKITDNQTAFRYLGDTAQVTARNQLTYNHTCHVQVQWFHTVPEMRDRMGYLFMAYRKNLETLIQDWGGHDVIDPDRVEVRNRRTEQLRYRAVNIQGALIDFMGESYDRQSGTDIFIGGMIVTIFYELHIKQLAAFATVIGLRTELGPITPT